MSRKLLATVLAGAAMLTSGITSAEAASGASVAHPGERSNGHDAPFTFAVIGDIPYGPAQIAAFPQRIARLNADPAVQLVDHLGDIKNGSSTCDDAYFSAIKSKFDTFADPLVYTPGDNEWTDCHRTNNGAYNPLERLSAIRSLFFPAPGVTLGRHPIRVRSQAAQGFVENVSYRRDRVSFAAVHIVGSNNSLAPWSGLGLTAPTPEQTSEVLARTAADIQLIRDTFARARHEHDRAVVLLTQADMFDATVTDPAYADNFAFTPIVAAIAQESRAFPGPVYLFNGDSHVFQQDLPLASGSPWLSFYGVPRPAENLHRITVEGSADVDEWVKVTVERHGPAVLRIERIPYS